MLRTDHKYYLKFKQVTMKIQKLKDGTLLVPKRVEGDGIIGDAVMEVKPTHEDYDKYLEQYQRERQMQSTEEE